MKWTPEKISIFNYALAFSIPGAIPILLYDQEEEMINGIVLVSQSNNVGA